MTEEMSFSKYEIARIVGARALQIAMNAPLLIKLSEEDLEKIKYDALKIAEVEFNSGALPINVDRPLPKKEESDELKREKSKKIEDSEVEERAAKEEKEIAEEGEIMAMSNPEEEQEPEEKKEGTEELE